MASVIIEPILLYIAIKKKKRSNATRILFLFKILLQIKFGRLYFGKALNKS